MSLFTDSDIASLALMSQIDPEMNDVAKLLGSTPIEGAGSIAETAWSECRSKLEAALATFSTYPGTAGSQALLAAVLNTGGWSSGNKPRLRLNQIVVSDTYYANSLSPIQRWVTYSALKSVFQTAAHRVMGQKNGSSDRYDAKRAFYEKKQDELWRQLLNQGMPALAGGYLDCPGAKHGYQAGVFSQDSLSLTAGGSSSADQLTQVAVTYLDGNRYLDPLNKNNAESGPSAIQSFTISAGNLLTVSIANLSPPSTDNPPPFGISQGIIPMGNASHWNVYVGAQSGPLYLQNAMPMPVSTVQYTLTGAPLLSGYQMGAGQVPLQNVIWGQIVQRG